MWLAAVVGRCVVGCLHCEGYSSTGWEMQEVGRGWWPSGIVSRFRRGSVPKRN